MKAYFVTGTDTEVGKTTVGAAILAAGTARGLRTRCLKPVESGCARGAAGTLVPADGRALWAATDKKQAPDSVVVYAFEEPVAPGVAAEREGVEIRFEPIRERLEEICVAGADLMLVEGAGGLLVPLGQGKTIGDLARFLSIPLLVIARPGLGTINHTLLTVEAARARGLSVDAVIFSASAGEVQEAAVASNAKEIERASGVPVLGCLPHLATLHAEDLGQAAESALDLDRLLHRG